MYLKLQHLTSKFLSETDPSVYIENLLVHLSNVCADPSKGLATSTWLAKGRGNTPGTLGYLRETDLKAVRETSLGLASFVHSIDLFAGRHAMSVAIGLVLIAIEGTRQKKMPKCIDVATELGKANGVAAWTSMERYREAARAILDWSEHVPGVDLVTRHHFTIDPITGKKWGHCKRKEAAKYVLEVLELQDDIRAKRMELGLDVGHEEGLDGGLRLSDFVKAEEGKVFKTDTGQDIGAWTAEAAVGSEAKPLPNWNELDDFAEDGDTIVMESRAEPITSEPLPDEALVDEGVSASTDIDPTLLPSASASAVYPHPYPDHLDAEEGALAYDDLIDPALLDDKPSTPFLQSADTVPLYPFGDHDVPSRNQASLVSYQPSDNSFAPTRDTLLPTLPSAAPSKRAFSVTVKQVSSKGLRPSAYMRHRPSDNKQASAFKHLDSTVIDAVRKAHNDETLLGQLLCAGHDVDSLPAFLAPTSVLGAVAALRKGGAEAVEDEELFGDGELEGYVREDEEIDFLRDLWEKEGKLAEMRESEARRAAGELKREGRSERRTKRQARKDVKGYAGSKRTKAQSHLNPDAIALLLAQSEGQGTDDLGGHGDGLEALAERYGSGKEVMGKSVGPADGGGSDESANEATPVKKRARTSKSVDLEDEWESLSKRARLYDDDGREDE